ncbi:MAG: ATP-binding cassette domain-containing protein [Porticoccus sp.]|nr:ATP-binding cassette domain-containing protein [Porticoccus sp.]MBQ0808213.1 ATP-binding cassette domain-containing protein [Porticoccus sp.]MDX2349408.1 ATP-binding cassette domain-containing protein [Porticoccus sp.]
MLEVEQLTRLYGDFKAVDNVSFKIKKGEIVGLLGHNGAGKTTIMKMLSGFIEANQGRIEIDGADIQKDLKQAQQNLGYLPENLPIYPEMTVADYLDYASEMKGLTGDKKITEIKRVIQATDIVPKLLSPISTLSRGYKQRVGVAQAILGDPKLLILDEPTNGLDPTQTQLIRALIRNLAKDATVILSTHIMQEVDALCNRALIIRNGQLALDTQLDDLHESNHLLLTTSLDKGMLDTLLQPLSTITGVEEVSVEGSVCRYRLEIQENGNPLELCGEVANLVVSSGATLYAIDREHMDLETLFREVNEIPAGADTAEVKDAA